MIHFITIMGLDKFWWLFFFVVRKSLIVIRLSFFNNWVLGDDFVGFGIWLFGFSYYPINLFSYDWPEMLMNLKLEKKKKWQRQGYFKLNLYSSGQQQFRVWEISSHAWKSFCRVMRSKKKKKMVWEFLFLAPGSLSFFGMHRSCFLLEGSWEIIFCIFFVFVYFILFILYLFILSYSILFY